jgi:hypothetical protein
MKRFLIGTLLSAALLLPAGFAQNDEKEGRIQQRKENQQQRIGNGVKSGQLTPGETARLETQESSLNKEIRTDRRQNGGNLTNNEKKQINRQQNRLSKDIYRDKHNQKKAQP